jgi:hypothetical protein
MCRSFLYSYCCEKDIEMKEVIHLTEKDIKEAISMWLNKKQYGGLNSALDLVYQIELLSEKRQASLVENLNELQEITVYRATATRSK